MLSDQERADRAKKQRKEYYLHQKITGVPAMRQRERRARDKASGILRDRKPPTEEQKKKAINRKMSRYITAHPNYKSHKSRKENRTADLDWLIKRPVKGLRGCLLQPSQGDFDLGVAHIILIAHYRNGLGMKRCLKKVGLKQNKLSAFRKILDGCGGIVGSDARRIRGSGSRRTNDQHIARADKYWWDKAQRDQRTLSKIDDCWAKHPAITQGMSAQMVAYYRDHDASKAYAAGIAKKRYSEIKHTPEFKVKIMARNTVARICRKVKSRRKPRTRTFEFLGCDYATAARHIERLFRPTMTWANHGQVWEVDHKKPLAAHDLTDEAQRAAAMHYKNLQPLFKNENRIKSDTWNPALDEEAEIKIAA